MEWCRAAVGRDASAAGHVRGQVSAPFAVALERDDDCFVVVVTGELDLSTAPALAAVIERDTPSSADLVIDLSELSFLDCAGLRVLLYARARADRGGGSLRLVPGPGSVQRVIRLAGLEDRLPSSRQPGGRHPPRRFARSPDHRASRFGATQSSQSHVE
jgi:anti-anti-sigma factor